MCFAKLDILVDKLEQFLDIVGVSCHFSDICGNLVIKPVEVRTACAEKIMFSSKGEQILLLFLVCRVMIDLYAV